MSIEISHETEARLAAEARRRGISVETLLARFLANNAAPTQPAPPADQLPIWHLGGVGDLHRRDIYDDAD
jgi:hypothetical protein